MSTKSQLNKSVQYYKTKQESQHAQQSANRFTQKQSQYARREEEKQVNESQASSGSVISRFEAGRRQDVRGRTHVPSTSTATPSYASGNKLMQSGNRRTQKYQLDNAPPTDQSAQERRRPREEVTSFGSLLGASSSSAVERDDGSDSDGEGPRKKTRFEKFQDVMTKSKMHRIEQQKERTTRDQETNLLDEEFDGVMLLLHKRDRIQEEREAFLASGNAEMREIMLKFKENRKAKVLRLDGATDNLGTDGLDASDRAVFAKLTHGQLINQTGVDASAPIEQSSVFPDDDDDFDAIMGSMRMETRKAHAVDRTLTEEEEFEHDQRMLQLQADRGEVPTIGMDSELWTRKEWIQRGGDDVFHMGDEDNVDMEYDEEDDDDVEEVEEGADVDEDEGSEDVDLAEDEDAPAAASVGPQISSSIANPVDRSLANLEAFSRDASKLSAEKRAIGYQALISDIHAASRRHAVHAAQSFRLLLLDAQRRVTKGLPLTPFLQLVLFTIPYVFPVSDYRHEVVTPYVIFLCSSITQMPLKTLANVKDTLLLCSLLVKSMTEGGKYCAEMLVAPMNVIALQVPKKALVPKAHQGVRAPCPILARSDDAILSAPTMTEFSEGIVAPLQLFDAPEKDTPERLLFAAYKLLAAVASSLTGNAGFPCAIGEPVRRLFALVDGHVLPALKDTHNATAETIASLSKASMDNRTPLMMRSFRPRPIRLFEPLLVENIDSEVKERRELKKEIREDRKRVVRHVQAEAVVERRAREKESQADSARREDKYNQLMGELQAQQHIMKSVDMSMSKAKGNKKKSISGAPTSSEGAGGEGGKDE
jgi:hypothetical protein